MNPIRKRLWIAIVLLGTGLCGQVLLGRQVEAAREGASVELLKPLNEFPDQIELWSGTDVPANPQIIEDIKIDQHLNRQYIHPSGEKVILWMSFSKRSLDQYHYPTVCMAGSGWTEDETGRERIVIHTGDNRDFGACEVPAMSMVFNKDKQKELVYYWYYLIGEDQVDRIMRQSSRWARAFLRGRRNASLTVEVFSQSPRPNRELLDEFARAVVHQLEEWMPKGTDADCTLGANY